MFFVDRQIRLFGRLHGLLRRREKAAEDLIAQWMQEYQKRGEYLSRESRRLILNRIYILMEITAINDELIERGWTLDAARDHIVDLPLFKLKEIEERMLAIVEEQRKIDAVKEEIVRFKRRRSRKLNSSSKELGGG